MESVQFPGEGLERSCTLRYAQHMKPSPVLPSIDQLCIVLRGMSPLIWRRLLVHSDSTLAHLHDILQIVFDWSEEHLHTFCVHGERINTGFVASTVHHVVPADAQ